MKKYDKIVKYDQDYKPIQDIDVQSELDAGMYTINTTPQGELFFTKMKNKHDGLLDLPATEYERVVEELKMFLDPECRKLFDYYDYLYKRSTLLHGLPGTGKTCIVNRVANLVVSLGGVVLFNPNPRLLREGFNAIESLQKNNLVMVIFEELDQLVAQYESELLNILDGEIQKENVIFMATTNHFNKIPARIKRPGRFPTVLEVGFPTKETRRFYLKNKLRENTQRLEEWVEKTEGFSIDELKETVLAVMCLKQDLDANIAKIRALHPNRAQLVAATEDDCEPDDYSDFGSEEEKHQVMFSLSNPKQQGKRR